MIPRHEMTEKAITEVTRRAIVDAVILEKISWSGRLEEQEFLARLYNLAEMASTDPRFEDASGDIRQHRVRNLDWGDDWLFYDRRFNLFHASDEEFLRFLCEMLHPTVQPDAGEVERVRSILNDQLAKDGWILREQMQLSGRPVFAAFRSLGSEIHTMESARVVTEAVGAEYVTRQVTRMQEALIAEPDVAIGTAKEFV